MIHTYDANDETLVRAKPLPVLASASTVVGFDANETVSSFAATMERIDTLADVTSDTIDASSLSGEIGSVTFSGLTRGVRYRLVGIFTRANGSKWHRTLIVDCVG